MYLLISRGLWEIYSYPSKSGNLFGWQNGCCAESAGPVPVRSHQVPSSPPSRTSSKSVADHPEKPVNLPEKEQAALLLQFRKQKSNVEVLASVSMRKFAEVRKGKRVFNIGTHQLAGAEGGQGGRPKLGDGFAARM